MGNRFEGRVRSGPRDVFAFEPIRTPVIDALSRTGMSANLIVDLLGIADPDVTAMIRDRVRNEGVPDVGAALLEWAARHAYREEHLSKAYAAACRLTLSNFAEPDRKREERLPHRVNHEVLQALSLWLEIGAFERESDARSGFYESALRIACDDDELDRGLAALVQLAFQSELAIPFDLVHDLLRETVKAACAHGIPPSAKPGSSLSDHLSMTEWGILRRQVRPFFAPMWPSGTGDRVRAVLRAADWSGDDAAEMRYLCDGVALHRAASEAYAAYRAAKDRGGAATATALESNARKRLQTATSMSKCLPDHDRRNAAQDRIAAWLANNHPDLIELVRPCGNPLGASW
ncbi:hypothetical protein EBS80_02765 [bacterium]|nr:hypothetical protein [bacterium]